LVLVYIVAFVKAANEDLKRPAIDEDLINRINSDPKSTWKPGRNEFFEGKSLAQAKRLLGFVPNPKKKGFYACCKRYCSINSFIV